MAAATTAAATAAAQASSPVAEAVARGSSTSRLSEAQVEAFHRDGFLLPGFRLEADRLAAARSALDELLVRNPGVPPELLVNSHLEDGEGEAEGVKGSSEFLALASHAPLVDLIAQCLGTENVILWACQIFCKMPSEGKAVPFHQDGQYWPIEPLHACTAWIALDRSDAENGALQVLPGTQKLGCVEHVQRVDEEACITFVANPEHVQPLLPDAQTLTLDAGEVSIHDSMLLHGSERNHSSRRRAGIAATYMPAECHFNREVETEGAKKGGIKLDFSKRPLFVVKGSNQHPENTLLREP